MNLLHSAQVIVCLLALLSMNACSLINPPVLDQSKNIEKQVDDYYDKAQMETTVLGALLGGGAGALACRNQSGGVIAACVAGGAALGGGIAYTSFSALSNRDEAKASAKEADRIKYLAEELKAEREYLQGFKKQTMSDLRALRKEVKAKKAEIAAGKRDEKDLEKMRAEVAESEEKVKELLAKRKQGMEEIAAYCEAQDVKCTGTLRSRRNALKGEITRLEKQVENEFALVQRELKA